MVILTIYNTAISVGSVLFVHYLRFHGIIVGTLVRSVIFEVLDVGFIGLLLTGSIFCANTLIFKPFNLFFIWL